MQTIMTLTLNESDDVSQKLLPILLAILRQRQYFSSAAHVLVKRVIGQCEKIEALLDSREWRRGVDVRNL